MRIIIFFTIMFIGCFSAVACGIQLKLFVNNIVNSNNNYEYTIQERDIHDSIFNICIRDKTHLSGHIIDCRGALSFRLVDSVNNLQIEGAFVNGLDTLTGQTLSIDVVEQKGKIRLYKYFEPLQNGIWKYKNLKGKLLKQRIYYDGVPDFLHDQK